MSDRLRRFRHLERARPDAPDGEAGVSSRERFGGTATSTPTSTPTPTPTSTSTSTSTPTPTSGARFLRPDLRAPDVSPKAADAQPFTRCLRCEADHSVHAATCATCGEALDTPAQRAFNERLWAERLRARDEEDRALAAQRVVREQAEAEAAAARREMGELLARETARQERDRLDGEAHRDGWGRGRWGGGWEDDGWGNGDPRPLGLRLLALIRNPRWRIGVAVGLLAAAALAGVLAFATRNPLAIYALVAVFAILFSPRRRRRWWR